MLQNKVILVTGAGSGIGEAAARLFTSYGATVACLDIDGAAAERIAAEVGGQALTANVADTAAVETAVEAVVARHGRLDGAFNNAGIEQRGAAMFPTGGFPMDDFDRVIAVNLRGVANCLSPQLREMAAAGQGAIVNTASVMGSFGNPGMAAYAASKHGVMGLTRVAALDYARQGIRVNAIQPGVVLTPMMTERAFPANPGYADFAEQVHPIGRVAMPAEIAEAAAWLLSDKSSFVTGAALAVDGGYSAQ
jgi:NAD(P)-dependent dehydrogenase (short-subunit alcohol dehydrogenase family)